MGRAFRDIVPEKVLSGMNHAGALILYVLGQVRDLFITVIFNPIGLLLGGGRGEGGVAFRQEGEELREVAPPLRAWRNILKLPNLSVNLPYVLQQWQKDQASTVYYEKPVRLAIVPPL
jgi:hypothetical protein